MAWLAPNRGDTNPGCADAVRFSVCPSRTFSRALLAPVVRRLASEYRDHHGESDEGADTCCRRHDRDAVSGACVRQPDLHRVGRQARARTKRLAAVLAHTGLAALVSDVWIVDDTRPSRDGPATGAVDPLRSRPHRADPSRGDRLDWWP